MVGGTSASIIEFDNKNILGFPTDPLCRPNVLFGCCMVAVWFAYLPALLLRCLLYNATWRPLSQLLLFEMLICCGIAN
jgi:hypothetical protein